MLPKLLLLVLAFGAAAAPVRADEFDDAIKGLEKAVKDKSKVDVAHFSAQLGEKFKEANDAQKKAFFASMKKAILLPDKDAKKAVVEALGKSDGRAVEILQGEVDKTKDDVQYQGWCVEAIGRLADVKTGAPYLKKLLNHKTIDVVASAIAAFGFFKDADFATKKDLVESMLKIYGSYTSAAKNARDTTAKNKLERVKSPFENSLKALTGQQDKEGYDAWNKWWNDTGKKADKW